MKIMSYVFWRIPTFVDQITTGKKGTVVWPSVGMFGGSMSSDCFGGFLDQITTRKLKVQLSGHRLQCRIILAGSSLCFFGRFLNQITNYNRKKSTFVWPSVGMSTTYF
jgi:hypothetical protein